MNLKPFFCFLLCSYLLCSCFVQTDEIVERPSDLWIRNTVLDQKIRILALQFIKEGYGAFDTRLCSWYKVWRGGIHWDGAVFNAIKTIQPASWGQDFIVNQDTISHWKCQDLLLTPQFKGYLVSDAQQIQLLYRLVCGLDTITVTETPELYLIENNKIVFERILNFTSKNQREAGLLWNNEPVVLARPLVVRDTFEWGSKPEKPERFISASRGQYWLDRSGCNTCHEEDYKTVGPAYRQIAARYPENAETITSLAQKVILGGSGNWGDIPMIPHPDLLMQDVSVMIQYILSLKPIEENAGLLKKATETIPDMPLKPGFGVPLEGVHPGYDLQTIHPDWFVPKIGGMDFLPDGRLLVSTWDSIGGVYAISGLESKDTSKIVVAKIASGLMEPLGLKTVGSNIFVLQKQELTQLIDHSHDGIIDEYRTICNSFDASPDFHEYSYGLVFEKGHFYANLGLAMRLMAHELQLPDRGSTIRITMDGQYEILANGLRQPNGIELGPEGDIFVTENQGEWVPACKIIALKPGGFYGCQLRTGNRHTGKFIDPPAVWLPQDEIANSPGQPLFVPSGRFAGQLLFGDVSHGGIKRVFLEKVNGQWQGVVFRFAQGFESGINRMVWGPDGALYVGGVGMNGGWGWKDLTSGLQRLLPNSNPVFEMNAIRALPDGLDIEFTEPLEHFDVNQIEIKQWTYEVTPRYGCPKLEETTLKPEGFFLSQNGKRLHLPLPGIKAGYVVYLRLDASLKSIQGYPLWSGEAWYTMNQIPVANQNT